MMRAELRASVVCLLAVVLLVCGCSSNRSPASSEGIAAAHRQGTVYGGQQPVSGASVQLYAVGTSGDGSPATPLLTPAATTDVNGGFNITGTYNCPAGNPLVYIVATGGNPGLPAGSSNSDIALMAALGPCGNLTASTFIVINELTTVGAVYPLAAFMTSPSAIGSSTSDAAALADAFTLASELVNTATGTTPGTNVPAGTTVPVAQINTIADILASCINSAGGSSGDGSACGSLFAMTTPATTPATPPATNTIGALLNLANNPTLNTAALYSLASPTAPFEPMQTVTPPDLGVRLIVPSGFGVSPGSLGFGSLTTGFTSTGQSVTLTNSGATNVFLSNIFISGANASEFALVNNCASLLVAGSSCTVQVTFAPSAGGGRSAWLEIDNSSANPVLSVALSGQGVAPGAGTVTASPAPLTFTQFGVAQNVTLTNLGNSSLAINGINFGSSTAFSQTNNCGTSLAAQSICTIAVTALGTDGSATLTVVDDAAAGPQTVGVSYSGLSGPSSFNFGGWSIGTQPEAPFNYYGTNASPGSGSLSGPNVSDFAIDERYAGLGFLQSGGCQAFGSNLCSFVVRFTPSALGLRTATLTTNSGVVTLSGTGQPAGINFSIVPNGVVSSVPLTSYNFVFDTLSVTSSRTLTVLNTGSVPVSFMAPTVTGANASQFSASEQCGTLAVGANCTLTISNTATQLGPLSATMTLTDSTAVMQQSLQLSSVGTPPGPSISPSSLSFPATPVNTVSASLPILITAYNNDPVTALVGQGSPFVLTQGSSCVTTPCTLYVAYAPTGSGQNSSFGSITVTDTAVGNPGGIDLSGLYFTPTTINFMPGSLSFALRGVNTTSIAQPVTLTNTGGGALSIASVTLVGANAGDYVLTNNCGSSVAIGGNCGFTVSFSPTAVGTRTAAVQIVSTATTSPDMVQLTGMAQ